MKKYSAMFEYNFKQILSGKLNIVFCFAMPIGFYLLMSLMFSNYGESVSSTLTQAMIPNFILIVIINALFNIFGVMFVETIATGNIEKYELLGIKKLTYSCALLLATLSLIVVVSISFVLFVAVYSGSNPLPQNILGSVLFLLISVVSQFSLMYMVTSLINRTSSYTSVAMMVFFIQMFTGGLTFPLVMFPEFLQKILFVINPMANISKGLLNVWVEGQSIFEQQTSLVYIAITTLLFIVIATLVNQLKHQSQTVKAH